MKNSVKFAIVGLGLILALVLFKYSGKFTEWYSTPSEPPTSTQTDIPLSSTVSAPESDACESPISYMKVESGTRKGVIEVGASGFNAFAIISNTSGEYNVIYKKFGESNMYEGMATTSDIRAGLKDYIGQLGNQGVGSGNIHFVVSSGALKNPKTTQIISEIKAKGYVVNTVTAEQEGKYAYKAQIPTGYEDNSMSVDIGSGNTKITWKQDGKLISKETHGAKYLQNNTTDAQAYNDVKVAVQSVPAQYRQNVFIIGGVPFKMASQTCEGSRYITLKDPKYYSKLDGDPKFKSGVNIYKAIYETAHPNKVVFDYDTNFTVGFLTSLSN